MFHKFSYKVFEKAFVKMKQLIQSSIGNCKSNSSWIEKSHLSFDRCTKQLIKSLPWLEGVYKQIERFSSQNMNSTFSTQGQLGALLKDVKLTPKGSNALEIALSFIESTPMSIDNSNDCKQIPGCLENGREIIKWILG